MIAKVIQLSFYKRIELKQSLLLPLKRLHLKQLNVIKSAKKKSFALCI